MGRSGITIPNPIRSMKTVRKRTTSGERRDGAGAGTARGNRKTPRAVKASAPNAGASSAAFGAEPPQTTNDVARLAEQRFSQPRRRRVEVAIAQRAQPARELAQPRTAAAGACRGQSLCLRHALLDDAQREIERPSVTGRRLRA